MAFEPQPFVELPNLRAPVALIVDDPAPLINPLWYFRHQVDRQESPAHERDIPLSFMEEWCAFAAEAGLRGDFTVLPYPAGLGRIDEKLEGYDTSELRAWVKLAREHIAPRFDIHCEILTHTNALDLKTLTMLEASEHDWMGTQNEETLTEYFAAAMRILQDAGLPNFGITQPCHFHGDESLYARALLAAEKLVNGRGVTHNFLYADTRSDLVPPRVTYLDTAAGEAVVSIWPGTDDYVWNAQELDSPDRHSTPQLLADRFIAEDGSSGRVADLVAGGGPVIMLVHWQTLFSNGTRLGLGAHREIVSRIGRLYGDRLAWRKLSEISSHFLAARYASVEARATVSEIAVDVVSPFATDIFTLSIPAPWPFHRPPIVQVDGIRQEQVTDRRLLQVGKWIQRGSIATLSMPLAANVKRSIAITAT